MVKVTELCTGCVQVITNPICPYCFSRHVITWMRDKNIPKEKMSNIKRLLKDLVREAEQTPSGIRCILCGSKRVNLCVYCYTNKASRIVEKNVDPETMSSFNEDFETIIWRV